MIGVPVGVAFQEMIGNKENNARMDEIIDKYDKMVAKMEGG
ncbi:MAG: hypothetical protein ACK41P_10520 [Asticcacaulis sp.]